MNTAPNLIGARLGAYEIQALLGSGGMATVYRGFDTNLKRLVAVKVLSAAAEAQPGFLDRFQQEARLIASLRHPNIVQVYDLGQHDDHTFMVQELLAGPTLDAWMRDLAARGVRPAPREIIAIVAQLAGALDVAHAAGIVHRDVKPANALWNAQGTLVLTDFGIAKQLAGGTNQTQLGIVFGTPSYLSPEQAQTLPLTPASDIYSLGVVLYELISGDVPFSGTTPLRVAMSHVQTPPPPLPPRPDLPPAVEAVVQRALAKDPAARFGSAGELAQALARAWDGVALVPVPRADDIHNQVTRVWAPPAPAHAVASKAASPEPAAVGAPVPPPAPSLAPPLTGLQASPQRRSRSMLSVLGALLAMLLLGGVALAARGGAKANTGAAVPATAAAQAPSALIAATSAPTAASAARGDPFAQLRALLTAGRADGRLGRGADELIEQLDASQQALAAGDTNGAVKKLTELQKKMLEGARDGTIDRDFLLGMLRGIQVIADRYGLKLPLTISVAQGEKDDD